MFFGGGVSRGRGSWLYGGRGSMVEARIPKGAVSERENDRSGWVVGAEAPSLRLRLSAPASVSCVCF